MIKKMITIILIIIVFVIGVYIGIQIQPQDQQHIEQAITHDTGREEAFIYNTDEAIAKEIIHYDVICVVDSQGYEYAIDVAITDMYTIDDTHTTVQQMIDKYTQ